ncbi:cell division protein ZapE [Marinobacterium jannaschii]|uniref:cell division protein ZapE n=1 Tax=Marinobacterium jannaschii TaxID=64970 RepID=UPI0006886D3B|nr:cell division protein ZapE [Marinobacterium jannaschii]
MSASDIQLSYQQLLQSGLTPDPAQQAAVAALFSLQQRLPDKPSRLRKPLPVTGLYLWGPVGRGKTLLMDLFYQSLDQSTALRLHFHRFMALMHRQLTELSGTKDPLRQIARDLAQRYRVLCFDEFFVSDIGDAMLLGRLFDYLFDSGIAIVTTSNCHPDMLYRDGLQRDRFLPAITAIKKQMQIHQLDGGCDHRRRMLSQSRAYFVDNAAALSALFPVPAGSQTIELCQRPLLCNGLHDGHIWFDFKHLCESPRSALDYIELAQRFHTVLLSGVPVLSGQARERIKARGTEDGSYSVTATGNRQVRLGRSDDATRRFISLIDELYDRRVNLFINAAVPLEQLYSGEHLAFEFERTRSRLIEMASVEYQSEAALHQTETHFI